MLDRLVFQLAWRVKPLARALVPGAVRQRIAATLLRRAYHADAPRTAAPAAFATADLTAWVRPATDVTVRFGVLNLTNARYFEWSNVRGRQATDPVIDRYSSPGISAVVSAAYGW